ncbi:hypothetical protein EV359DRAFT_84201 [Lentinula novae-zelandiae]|nr:hypothetical protein EV359DRAFT_84201 [Lentinula novae-zelandiae]
MSTSCTQTTTTSSSTTAGPSRSRPTNPPPADPVEDDQDVLDEDDDEAIRRVEEKVRKMKARKAAAEAKRKAKAEAARKAAEEAQKQREVATRELEERRRVMAEAAATRSRRGSSSGGSSVSPRRPVVEIRKEKGKGKAKAQPVGGDPDDGGDGGDDDDEGERAPCERCRSKKIPCQMQAGKRSSIICKPCHDAKVKCSYSGRPSTVKREGGGQPTGERLAVLESQMAQLLADNWQLREGQLKAVMNITSLVLADRIVYIKTAPTTWSLILTSLSLSWDQSVSAPLSRSALSLRLANNYNRHFNRKLDWLRMDAARRRNSPPEMPEPGTSRLPKKRRRVVDSEEEEEDRRVGEDEDGEGDEEVEVEEEEGNEPVPKKARSEKGKEREE